MITVYAVDAQLCLMHATQSASKGFRDVVVDPTVTVSAGEVLKWVTTLDPIADAVTFGTEGTGAWEAIADYRETPLYLTTDGSSYTLDSTVAGQSFNGLGTLPTWLTSTAMPGKNYNWVNGAWTLNIAAQLVDDQAAQTALMYQAYDAAVTQSVSFKSAGGVTQTFDADTNSQNVLLQSYTGFAAAGSVPTGFYWVAADNTQVPFTLADLKGLYAAMLTQGWIAFQQLQERKASIRAATTSAAVKAIVW